MTDRASDSGGVDSLRRGVWAAAAQGTSSLGNLVLAVAVARTASPAEFGAFALVISTYRIALAIARALGAETFIIRYADSAAGDTRDASSRRLLGLTLAIGIAAGVASLGIGALVGGATGVLFAVLGVVLPLLMLQDACRFALTASFQVRRVAVIDGLWLLLQIVGMGLIVLLQASSPAVQLGSWGAAGSISAIVGTALVGAPKVRSGIAWLAHEWRSALQFISEYLLIHASVQGAYMITAGVAGLAAAGALRAAETVFGPFSVLVLGIRPIAVSELSRHRGDPAGVRRRSVRLTALLVAGAVSVALLAFACPDRLGELLLGDVWAEVGSVLPGYSLYAVAVAVAGGAMIAARALALPALSLRARILEVPAVLLMVWFGASTSGAAGASLGLAVGAWVGASLTWVNVTRAAPTR